MRAKAVSGVWNESSTTADRFDRNKESAKHRMPERQSRMQKHGLRHSSGFPCYLRRLHRILFQCRYATLRLLLSTGRDSDDPPSCVVGLSQTRLSGDRQFHIFRNFQFQYIVIRFHRHGNLAPVIMQSYQLRKLCLLVIENVRSTAILLPFG